jgi:LEA14-like dessication related protein
MNVVFIVAVIAAGIYFSDKEFDDNVNFSIGKIKFNLKDSAASLFTKLHFSVEGKINNPTNLSVTVNGITATVYFKGKAIANLNQNEQFNVAPNNSTSILSDVAVNTLNVFTSIDQAKQMISSKQVELNIIGKINLNSGVLSINKQVKVEL